ncbi:hypothetical protein [Streptomyces sp. NPDC058202]|uniref:hypothetical protein n=1 Tax=Streptomyces sp. NPDC058202 TaxID=3346380 RepID=UPI0036E63DF6
MDRISIGIALASLLVQPLSYFPGSPGSSRADTNVTVNVTVDVTQSDGLPAVPPVCPAAPRRE